MEEEMRNVGTDVVRRMWDGLRHGHGNGSSGSGRFRESERGECGAPIDAVSSHRLSCML
jgi:hypothetical protein